ncbi:MAG: hypothetical protein HYY05_03895 [Chloroflexi bacterium]|nr:hypothetical protein [Chloroflexota bacterium]
MATAWGRRDTAKRTVVVLVVLLAGLAGSIGLAEAVSPGEPHYPDLRTRTPADLQVLFEAGKKVLRFSNTVYNWGKGPLELRPKHKPHNTTEAYQRVYSHDTSGSPFLVSESLVGTFVFHRSHRHCHFEGFDLYELLNDSGGNIGSLINVSKKTTVCIRDNADPEPGAGSLDHFGWGGYWRCDKNATEGLSVGYGDTYPWNIEGQSLDISGLPDGCYWLRSTANPDGNLQESDYSNNWAAIRFFVSGTAVSSCP